MTKDERQPNLVLSLSPPQRFQLGISIKIGTLSKDVFERRTSTGSEAFSLFICLDANKLVLLSFFSLLKTIYPRVSTKPLPNDAKSPLPVDVRLSKTLLLKLPNIKRAGDDEKREKAGASSFSPSHRPPRAFISPSPQPPYDTKRPVLP